MSKKIENKIWAILSSPIWHRGVSGKEKWQEFSIPEVEKERLLREIMEEVSPFNHSANPDGSINLTYKEEEA